MTVELDELLLEDVTASSLVVPVLLVVASSDSVVVAGTVTVTLRVVMPVVDAVDVSSASVDEDVSSASIDDEYVVEVALLSLSEELEEVAVVTVVVVSKVDRVGTTASPLVKLPGTE